MRVFVNIIIFCILCGVFSGASSGIMVYYLYSTSKRDIGKIEKEARNVAETLTDASSKMAELGRGKARADQMNQFFKYNLDRKLFYKAFFVLENGTIEAHSNPGEVKELRYNIAADEFRYNLEQIYQPIHDQSKNIYFVDYFILDKKIPFRKKEIKYLKKYLYAGIDRNGWLANRSVYEDGKAVGTVNFLIGKDKVYSLVRENLRFVKHSLPYLGGGSVFLSLFLMILLRLTSSTKVKHVRMAPSIDPESINILEHDDVRYEPVTMKKTGSSVQIYEIKEGSASSPIVFEEFDGIQVPEDEEQGPLVIQDAIPIRKRR